MKRTQPTNRQRFLPYHLACIWCALGCAAPVLGEDFLWKDGPFHFPSSWWNDAVPGESDTAILPSMTSPYEHVLSFHETPGATDRMIIQDLELTINMYGDGAYTLLNQTFSHPSLVVGEQFGDQAHVIVTHGLLRAMHVVIAQDPGATGLIQVGETVSIPTPGFAIFDGHLSVGEVGSGALHVVLGALETNLATLGARLHSDGEALVEGSAASWTNQSFMIVGKFGSGSLVVRNAGTVNTGSVIVAQAPDSVASVLIEHPGSELNIAGNLDVGYFGEGDIQVRDGGRISVEGFCSIALWADAEVDPYEIIDQAVGLLDVSGEGAIFECGQELYFGHTGNGTINVSNGATLTAAVIEFPGYGANKLLGNGTINADVLGASDPNDDNAIAPGTSDPETHIGELTVNGNVTAINVELEFAGTAPGQFDRLLVNGMFDGQQATIRASLLDGFVPKLGDSWDVVTTDQLVSGFASIIGDELPEGLAWSVSSTSRSVLVAIITDHTADLDSSGEVDAADLAIVLGNWGVCDDPEDCPADLDGDGVVGAADLAIVLGNWGPVD